MFYFSQNPDSKTKAKGFLFNEGSSLVSLLPVCILFPIMAMILLFSLIVHKRIYYEQCFLHVFLQLTFVDLQVAFLYFSLDWSNKAGLFTNTYISRGHIK